MRVFVTGASGFVGSHLTRILLDANCTVTVLAIPDDPLTRLADIIDRITVVRGALADRDLLHNTLKDFKPEACIHLAWYAEPGKYLYSPLNVPTLVDSIGLLEALIQNQCKQAIMVGTCAEYDTDVGLLKEDSPTKPVTIYAATKLSLALIGEQMTAGTGTHFTWARLFYLYGPQEDERRMIPSLIKKLHKGETFEATAGEQVRDYLHVEDVASALWFLAANNLSGVFNISSGTPITIRMLIEMIQDAVGQSNLIRFGAVPYRQWEPMFICGDNTKLRSSGWQPRYSLREGLAETIQWWRERLK